MILDDQDIQNNIKSELPEYSLQSIMDFNFTTKTVGDIATIITGALYDKAVDGAK
jgi:hypothetical protein